MSLRYAPGRAFVLRIEPRTASRPLRASIPHASGRRRRPARSACPHRPPVNSVTRGIGAGEARGSPPTRISAARWEAWSGALTAPSQLVTASPSSTQPPNGAPTRGATRSGPPPHQLDLPTPRPAVLADLPRTGWEPSSHLRALTARLAPIPPSAATEPLTGAPTRGAIRSGPPPQQLVLPTLWPAVLTDLPRSSWEPSSHWRALTAHLAPIPPSAAPEPLTGAPTRGAIRSAPPPPQLNLQALRPAVLADLRRSNWEPSSHRRASRAPRS